MWRSKFCFNMRLFIALQFDEVVLDALADLQEDLRSQGITGNFTKRENLHITLAFIGEYGNPNTVLDAMETVDFEPVTINFNGIGMFRDLFWIGIEDNPGLVGYVKRLRRELANEGIPFDRKRFSPHVTLVRKYRNRNDALLPQIEIPTETVRRVSLMQSIRGKHGMVYAEIGGVEL